MAIIKQWFGFCRCRGARSPVSCWVDCKATLVMTGEKVLSQLGRWERKRKGGGGRKGEGRGESEGASEEGEFNGPLLSGWTLSQTEERGGKHQWDKQVNRDNRERHREEKRRKREEVMEGG